MRCGCECECDAANIIFIQGMEYNQSRVQTSAMRLTYTIRVQADYAI